MSVIEVRGEIPKAPELVWKLLGDFAGVASWNPFVERVDIHGNGIGMTRTVTPSGGSGQVIETLEILDDVSRRIRYGVLLDSGAHSVADIRIKNDDNGGSLIVWQSIRESELTSEQQEKISATLTSRIEALSESLSAR